MTRTELITNLQTQFTELTKEQIQLGVLSILDCLTSTLSHGDRIEIRGFGVFSIKNVQARHARNPRTNKKVAVPATRKVHFKPGKKLQQMVNYEQ